MEEEKLLMESLGAVWTDEDAMNSRGAPVSVVDEVLRIRAGGKHQPQELSNILIDRMVKRLSAETLFNPGARELLSELSVAAVSMALVSASTRTIMDAALTSIGQHHFKITISHDDVALTKPSPEGYLAAAAAIGVPIEKTLIIEDSITGVTAGIESGAYVLGLTHTLELPRSSRTVHHSGLLGVDMRALSKLFQAIIS